MTQEELDAVLEKHKKWLRGEPGGERAVLDGAVLDGASLEGASLNRASLNRAVLDGASLVGASLDGAVLDGASLVRVKGIFVPLSCPDSGEFVGWKKCRGDVIAKLKIPADAKRSSAAGRKCRCDKATVLALEKMDGTEADCDCAYSVYDPNFVYRTGDTVTATDFDECRWNECSAGIHFFITRDEAVRYE